ncbi:MAG: asparagine synthase-related protein [Acidobacteria bacterium]|nr:asparagine synthase-related protein [Acidobacteriota bacterium]
MKGLEAMLAALPGPMRRDVLARWMEASVAFGCRGLRVEEAQRARSLCVDAASGHAIIASARLDGRAALCETLGVPRPDRAGLLDAALILKSYERWGRACPEHLLGDYTFALWDAERDVLLCARDHIGTRPFFYAFTEKHFVFASDMDAVLAAPGVSGDLDEATVATRLTFGARSSGARTFYRAVRRLPAGHTLVVQRGTSQLRRWWCPDEVRPARGGADDALAEECLALLTEAVRDRVRDDGPIGVHLSGGLDSSAITVLACRELRRHGRPAPPAFAWHPPPGPGGAAEGPEYGAIKSICRQEDLRVFYRPPAVCDVVAFLRRDGTRGADETTLVHEDVVQRAAVGRRVEVLLSGWGGDEGISFNGRGYYPQLLRNGQVRRVWRELREWSRCPLAALVAAALPVVFPGAKRGARRLWRGRWPWRENVTFIHPEFARRVRPLPAEGRLSRNSVRDKQVHLLQGEHLSRRMEAWAASGARHGIEYRYPLLDRRVLEFALGLPPEQYRRGRWSRWLMRRALAPVLPPEVCWNPIKHDSARVGALHDAIAAALPKVRGMIVARGTPLPRSRYLAMPRLMEHLDSERWRATGRPAAVANALRFLDF